MTKTSKRATLIVLGLLAVGGAAFFFLRPGPDPTRPDGPGKKATPEEADRPAFALVGSPSCSAASCHGGIEPVSGATSGRNEFTLWSHRDPHTRAYEVLKEKLSLQIMEHLNRGKEEKDRVEAHKNPVCLACHINPLAAHEPESLETVGGKERLFGVGCESCHGGAQDWVVAHTDPSWQKLSPQQKFARGMVPVEDPAKMFHNCAGCHVGAPEGKGLPGRDVHHDLIAAGHPQLRFEPSTFLANLPPHWNPDRKRHQDRQEGQQWALGQIAAARASLELTKARMEYPHWPELAEFSCFACHHDLKPDGYRQENYPALVARKPGIIKAGQIPWSPWYWTGPALLAQTKTFAAEGFTRELDKVQTQFRFTPALAAGKLKPDIAGLNKQLDLLGEMVRGPWDGERSSLVLNQLLNAPALKTADWDQLEQAYLAMYALNQDARVSSIRKGLDDLQGERAFVNKQNSPGPFHPDTFLSQLQKVVSGK